MIELGLLRTGQIDLPRSTFFPDGGPEIIRIPVWSGLLRTSEGVVLHAFEGKAPFGPQSIEKIVALKKVYGLDLDASASHKLIERNTPTTSTKKKGARRG